MNRYHIDFWNGKIVDKMMLILTEDDVESMDFNLMSGSGYELLILPIKYINKNNIFLDTIRMIVSVRCGEILYI
jgi:hypothetical protein